MSEAVANESTALPTLASPLPASWKVETSKSMIIVCLNIPRVRSAWYQRGALIIKNYKTHIIKFLLPPAPICLLQLPAKPDRILNNSTTHSPQ